MYLDYFEKELSDPSFKEYHLFFFHEVSDDVIRKFAEFDKYDVVHNI